jgi:hypothetical protein
MTKSKILSAVLIGAAMLATPAMARETHVARHLADRANATAMTGERYVDGRACIPAPRVGAFASDPWDNGPPCEPQAY